MSKVDERVEISDAKVLVVEDNIDLLEDIALALQKTGYEVVQAQDGQHALSILTGMDVLPDVIVSDIAMPDIDGFKLLEHLRSDPRLEHIPCLFLTAFSSPDYVRRGKLMGIDDYIVKPFKADELIIAMENKLKRIERFRTHAQRDMIEARETLLSMISHELRTPLTAIYGGSEMLADMLISVPDDVIQSLIVLIRKGADRLNRLAGNALAMLQIDSGQLEETFQDHSYTFEMGEMLQAAISNIQEEVAVNKRDVTFEVDWQPTPIFVNGVSEYLRIMMEEPLRNAVAASPDGTTVRVKLHKHGDELRYIVIDEGRGIAAKDIDRVWEPFAQIDRDKHEQQGTGLGLTIVQRSAHIHGGDATLYSVPGQSTRFTLSLPLVSH